MGFTTASARSLFNGPRSVLQRPIWVQYLPKAFSHGLSGFSTLRPGGRDANLETCGCDSDVVDKSQL